MQEKNDTISEKTPLVTVILPVWNAETFLVETLASLRAQSFTDWECICVDDGSTDGSLALLRQTAEEDPRFVILTQPNSGPGVARNVALDRACGTWLFFLDADDLLHPNAFATLLAAAEDGVDLIRGGFTRAPEDLFDQGSLTCVDDPVAVMCSDKRWRGLLWGALWRRSIVGELRLPPWKNHEDIAWSTAVTLRLRGERLHSAPLYCYRTTQGLNSRPEALESLPQLWSFQARLCPQIAPLLGEFAASQLKKSLSPDFWRQVAGLHREGLLSWKRLTLAKRFRLWRKLRSVKA